MNNRITQKIFPINCILLACLFIYIKHVLYVLLIKVEMEFKTGSVSASQISQKLGTIMDRIKQQGFEVKEIEMDGEKNE
jgi:hypothetical protein